MSKSHASITKRHDDILNLLRQKGVVYTSDLRQAFDVTDMTIRRDLASMEEDGLLVRFHGGAKPCAPREDAKSRVENPETENSHKLPMVQIVSQRIATREKEKDIIAKKAASLIDPRETIFMNSGTTCLYVLKYLGGKNVRIVSNNASMMLVDRAPDTELTIAGGEHFVRTQSFVGPLAKNVFENVYASKCILGAAGISYHGGITSSCLQETEINNLMIQQCQGKRIVVADGTKVGVSHSFVSCKINDIDMLITDKSADPAELDKLRLCGLEIIVVDDDD